MAFEPIPDDYLDELISEFGAAPATPSIAAANTPTLDNGLYLGTGQAAVAHPGGPVSHLATDNVVGCLGIVVQNPQTGSVGLVHLMANHNGGNFDAEWNEFLKPTIDAVSPNGGAVNFQVFGGIYPPEAQGTGQHFSGSIMNMLENVPNGNIVSADLGDRPHPAGIIVDVNSGAITPTSHMITTHEQGAAYFERREGALVDLSTMPRPDVDPLDFGLVYNQDRPAGLDTARPATTPATQFNSDDTVVLGTRPEPTRLDIDPDATIVQFDGSNPFRPSFDPDATVIQPQASAPSTAAPSASAHAPEVPSPHGTSSGFLGRAAEQLSHMGKNSGVIGGVVLGAAAGAATLLSTGSAAEAAQTVYETAVPYGETQIDVVQGDMQAAAKSATIETASNIGGLGGAVAGAAAGAAIGSVVPVVGTAVGAAAGAVIGGIGAGVATAAITETVLEHGQAIADAASDAANSVADFASETAGTVGNYASSAWSSLTSYFNDTASSPAPAVAQQVDAKAAYAQQISNETSIRSPAVEAVSIRTPMAWERTQTLAAYGGHDTQSGSFGSSINLDDPTSKGALSARVFGPAMAADMNATALHGPRDAAPAPESTPVVSQATYRPAAMAM